jgi:predicted  nucleic acid-binding Zn-ribbon protein
VAKSPTEQIRDLALEMRAIVERERSLRDHCADLKQRDQKREEEVAQLRRELAEVRQENAVVKQQLQDHISQYQEWDRRRWGVIVLLLGAVLSLASGLIVTLAKK